MKLQMKDYRNKLMGCWLGKNVGGTLGAPFECKRGVFDVTTYTQKLFGEPLPNDDLDLQLVWLNAAEQYGRGVNAAILGEYWHTWIVPNWGEYGAGKNNMRMGLLPPLSGTVNNVFGSSCGAFIRSEIWACLCPGHPELAVRYAYEDAIVDHSREGVYAEVFCAAVESAAFAEPDKFRLIDIGLSFIPADCGISRAVRCVLDAHSQGSSWQEARKVLLNAVPGSFGVMGMKREELSPDEPVGEMGWDAPSNIGIMLIGWLYGGDDFGESLCIAVNCGEDADCTAATLGSILGILTGADGLDGKWLEPLGNKIKTLCIKQGDRGISIPDTVDALTERIMNLTPTFLGGEFCDFFTSEAGYALRLSEGEALMNRGVTVNFWHARTFDSRLAECPYVVRTETPNFDVLVDYGKEPFLAPGQPFTVRVIIENKIFMQQWVKIRVLTQGSVQVLPGRVAHLSLEQYHCNIGRAEWTLSLQADMLEEGMLDAVIEVSSLGHHVRAYVPVVLIGKTGA